jgi:hypothetical protein
MYYGVQLIIRLRTASEEVFGRVALRAVRNTTLRSRIIRVLPGTGGGDVLARAHLFNSPNFRTVILTITLLLLYFHNLEL